MPNFSTDAFSTEDKIGFDYEVRAYGLQEDITFDLGCFEYVWETDMSPHFQMVIDNYYTWRDFFLEIDFATMEFSFSPPTIPELGA